MNDNRLFDKYQSCFRADHNTETALFNDILLAADNGQTSLLLPLDLTAAFDIVDVNLIQRLKH